MRKSPPRPRTWILLLGLLASSAPRTQAQDNFSQIDQTTALLESSHLLELHNQYLAVWQALSPEAASRLGLHEFDGRLTPYDDNSYLAGRSNMERFTLLLGSEVKADRLRPADRVDYDLFSDALELGLSEYQRWDVRKNMPQLYLDLSSVYDPLAQDYSGLIGRASDALSRLEALPAQLEQARLLIAHPPRLWTERALEECGAALAFLKELPAYYAPLSANDALLVPRLKSALGSVSEAVGTYRTFLRQTVLPRSDGDFAIGRKAYDSYVRLGHHLDLNAGKIESIGRSQMRQAKRQLRKEARSIDRRRDWWDILDDVKKNHPAYDGVAAALRGEIQRALAHVRRLDLAPLPAGDIRVVPMPPFLRSRAFPYAYLPPSPLDTGRTGLLLLAPVDPALPEAERAQLLAEAFNSGELECAAARLAYPGLHVQAELAKQGGSAIRKTFGTPVLSEGWGLYSEELAYESGFYTSELVRLTQLQRRLLAAALAVLDVRLHTQGMSPEEAADFLVSEVRVSKPRAQALVLRLTSRPTWGMEAIVGFVQIEKLRDRMRHYFGRRFNLREFHERLLSYGALPPALIEKQMERDWMKRD